MLGDIRSGIDRILNDVELSDDKKILRILSSPPSLNTSPIGFVTILDIIKEDNLEFVDEHQKIILDFLKTYSKSSSDLIEKNSLFKDRFIDILSKYYSDNNSKSLLNNFLKLISSSISQTIVWSDFDHSSDGLQNSLQPPSPYSSQGSSRSSSPPPPPPPRAKPVILGLTLELLPFPLPIATSDNGPVDKSGITVMSKVVSNGADSQEFNQGSSAIIDDHNHQKGLLPLPKRLDSNDRKLLQFPKRLDLDGDQASQQNINSSPVVLSDQNQGVDANDLAIKASTASSHITFVSPQRLGPEDSSNVSSTMSNVVSVIPFKSNSSGSLSNTGSESSSNSDQGKPEQDGQGEQTINSCCSLFSRVCQRFRRFLSKIPSCSFKCFSASCLRSSKSRVEPRPLTP